MFFQLISSSIDRPWKRAILGFSSGYLLMHFTRPSFSFFPDGTAKEFGFEEDQTWVPWYSYPIGGAILLSVFL